MKVLVTGATGFLGGHIVDALLSACHEVRALVRRTSRTERLEKLGIEILLGEMKDADSLRRAVEGVEGVVHAASTMSGVLQEYVAATVEGTRALLIAAADAGVRRFIYVSSIGVHRIGGERTISEETPYEDNPEMLGPYTNSKIAAEQEALAFARSGPMEVVVVRPGCLYGPGGKWNISRLGYTLGSRMYMTVGFGHALLPVCYVKNCAGAIKAALEATGLSGETFNIVDDETFTARDYLKRVQQEVRPDMRIIPGPYWLLSLIAWGLKTANRLAPKVPRPIRKGYLLTCTRKLWYSNEKAKRELGWMPRYSKAQALNETMGYFTPRERLSRRADPSRLGEKPEGDTRLMVALIGAGAIAESHLRVLDGIDCARAVAVCDRNIEAARALCDRFRIVYAYSDAEEMIKKEKPHVVHILTPPQSHAALAELAISNGCHVLVEKPMAMNAEEARRMVALAAEKKVWICVDHNHQFDRVMIKARRIVESARLGDLLWLESYYGFDLGNNLGSRYMLPGGDKHWTFGIPGGLYQNLAPHPLSVALEVMGKPTKIQATARYGRVLPHQETDELRIFLESDRMAGLVTVSLAASPRHQYLHIYGTKGTLFVDLLNKWLVLQAQHRGIPKSISRALMNLSQGWAVIWGTLWGTVKTLWGKWDPYEGMHLLIREYYAALVEGREPPVREDEALAVMDVMDETWRQIGMGPKAAVPPPAPDGLVGSD
jgi:predicted dehydrogenase/nucleoside-diphosphate-sugar epimerase